MKEEARQILTEAVEPGPAPANGLGTALHGLFKSCGDEPLELPPREPMREPPRFE